MSAVGPETLEALQRVSLGLDHAIRFLTDRHRAVEQALRETTLVLGEVLRAHAAPDVRVFATQVDDVDLKLLAALDRGLTQRQVCKELHLSEHEVKARIRRLHAVTRTKRAFDLGRVSAARSWVAWDPGRLPGE